MPTHLNGSPTVQSEQEIYRSANGDRWSLIGAAGSAERIVRHHANPSSGGRVTDLDVEAFLAIGGAGPETQQLKRLLDAEKNA